MTSLRIAVVFLLAACSDDASPPGTDGGRADASRRDAGLRCGAASCDPGELCCEATGSCYDPACLSCCMPRGDAGTADASTDAGADAAVVTCGSTTCDSGDVCCEETGMCYDPACLSCCMPRPDAGFDAGPAPVLCGDGRCAVDEVCCEATGRCYDPACLSCCMPIVPFDAGPPVDAGDDCRSAGCADGRLECCELTGLCYDPRCLSCCMFPPPPPICASGVACARGEECCESTGLCVPVGCEACCPP